MNNKINLLSFRLAFIIAVIGLLIGLAWSVVGTPVQAKSRLPDRNTPTPAPPNDDDDDDNGSAGPVGAYIELHLNGDLAGGWAVVQWQSPDGGWHDVEGWQGPLPANTRWWVHPKDFGTGPFRWAIYDAPGGDLLGASEPFNLPGGANQVIRVEAARF